MTTSMQRTAWTLVAAVGMLSVVLADQAEWHARAPVEDGSAAVQSGDPSTSTARNVDREAFEPTGSDNARPMESANKDGSDAELQATPSVRRSAAYRRAEHILRQGRLALQSGELSRAHQLVRLAEATGAAFRPSDPDNPTRLRAAIADAERATTVSLEEAERAATGNLESEAFVPELPDPSAGPIGPPADEKIAGPVLKAAYIADTEQVDTQQVETQEVDTKEADTQMADTPEADTPEEPRPTVASRPPLRSSRESVAQRLLADARRAIDQGNLDAGAALALRAKGLRVRYSADGDTPDKVLRHVAELSRRSFFREEPAQPAGEALNHEPVASSASNDEAGITQELIAEPALEAASAAHDRGALPAQGPSQPSTTKTSGPSLVSIPIEKPAARRADTNPPPPAQARHRTAPALNDSTLPRVIQPPPARRPGVDPIASPNPTAKTAPRTGSQVPGNLYRRTAAEGRDNDNLTAPASAAPDPVESAPTPTYAPSAPEPTLVFPDDFGGPSPGGFSPIEAIPPEYVESPYPDAAGRRCCKHRRHCHRCHRHDCKQRDHCGRSNDLSLLGRVLRCLHPSYRCIEIEVPQNLDGQAGYHATTWHRSPPSSEPEGSWSGPVESPSATEETSPESYVPAPDAEPTAPSPPMPDPSTVDEVP